MTSKILIKTILLIAIASFCLACSEQVTTETAGEPRQTNITILHINDTHAHLEDIARRATKVNEVRNERGKENVLLLDAGDVFMGTPYFNLMHGMADLEFMKMLKYDAMALGNHEFDGFDKQPVYLANFIKSAPFPILSANLDVTKEPDLKDKVSGWLIIERAGTRFGVFGLTTEDTAVISNPGPNIRIKDRVTAATEAVLQLEKKGINKIIALTHIGWSEDIELAKKVKGIDLIIGGHSHTLPANYPKVIGDKEPTLVVQAEAYGKYLGRLDIAFDKNGVIQNQSGTLFETKKFNEDHIYAAKLAEYSAPIEQLKATIIGETIVDLNGERDQIRTRETNLGNLVADAFLDKAKMTKATIAIINGGSIRTSIQTGRISLGQLLEIMPFNNDIMTIDLTGEQIIAALENGVSQAESQAGRFPQVSGIRFTWNPKAQPGSRIIRGEIKTASGYGPIEPKSTYRIVTNSFLYEGGDGYSSFQKGTNPEYLGFVDYEILKEYIVDKSPLNARVEERIVSQANEPQTPR